MVFCSFREGVTEIVVSSSSSSAVLPSDKSLSQDTLNEANPLIRAHKFVGRANASKDDSDKGLTQKQQKEVRLPWVTLAFESLILNTKVIDKFRNNDYNVLVSTSIGEEGLDIGEVDFIIIYNCPNSSIKMVSEKGCVYHPVIR